MPMTCVIGRGRWPADWVTSWLGDNQLPSGPADLGARGHSSRQGVASSRRPYFGARRGVGDHPEVPLDG